MVSSSQTKTRQSSWIQSNGDNAVSAPKSWYCCKHLGSIQEIQKDQKASVKHGRRATDNAFEIIWRAQDHTSMVRRPDKTSDSNKHTNVGVIEPFPGQRSILPNWVSLVSLHKPQARELQPEKHWKWINWLTWPARIYTQSAHIAAYMPHLQWKKYILLRSVKTGTNVRSIYLKFIQSERHHARVSFHVFPTIRFLDNVKIVIENI